MARQRALGRVQQPRRLKRPVRAGQRTLHGNTSQAVQTTAPRILLDMSAHHMLL